MCGNVNTISATISNSFCTILAASSVTDQAVDYFYASQSTLEVTLDNPFSYAWLSRLTYLVVDSSGNALTMPDGGSVTVTGTDTDYAQLTVTFPQMTDL